MSDIKYCKRCVQPNTRPGISFYDGVCGACVNFDKGPTQEYREPIDAEFKTLLEYAKSNSKGGFDCIVGVSGGKDSHFQALHLKEHYGMNVLLVNCVPDAITDVGRRNMENLVNQGFECIHIRTNPIVMKHVTKRSFYDYGNPVKASEYSLHATSFRTALAFGVPLVFLGEDPGTTHGVTGGWIQGGDAMNIKDWNTLNGCNSSDWYDAKFGEKDFYFYQFPDVAELTAAGIKAAFFGYYVKEFEAEHNIEFSISRGLSGIEIPEWFQKIYGYPKYYSSIDSELQMINRVLKYRKMGWADITAICSDKIRRGKMTREEAIQCVEKYEGVCDQVYIDNFCKYLDITETEFWRVVGLWTNKDLFSQGFAGNWIPKFEVGVGM